MEFFGIPFFDDDVYKMMLRLGINMFYLTAIIRLSYYHFSKKTEYLFTFYLVGVMVFFLCFTLKKYELDLGLALGLFAIFGILRYRTEPLKVREMTYLFVVLGVSVMNALSNKKMSFIEIITANTFIFVVIFYLDRYWSLQRITPKEKIAPKDFGTQDIIYNSLENIKPKQNNLLREELENSLGVEILKLDIGEVDFEKQTVKIKIRYKK
ncbi:DUF4956 domain-containing protein [Flavobacteriaceae bacterium]|jgi:hypothetical protein|nr:DUF4956 domain-containing protein [Flavobacteriaceae bacterium]MDB2632212.1 DUF4956 domain-containing protein [Flavobacteriaceae bacterium]CAI8392861.1 MAG: Uncharacterised protein [Formosa sp. Hel3_A1_48]